MTSKHDYRPSFALSPRFQYLNEEDRYLTAPAKPKYTFNIIGGGIIGQEHIRVTLLEGRATIKGVYDPNPRSVMMSQKEAETYSPGLELVVYDTIEEACNDPDVDGLIICTPNYMHIQTIEPAVSSGKHILLEKPIATTVQDAYEITQMAEAYEAVFQLGLQYRFKPQYVEALHEVLERGSVGTVQKVSMMEHRIPFLDKVGQWNKLAEYSGDTLVEKCCHYFDLMNKVAGGRAQSVFAVGSQAVNFKDLEVEGRPSDILDNAYVTVTYENGVTGSFDLSMFSPFFHEEMVVSGDKGRLKATERRDSFPHSPPATALEVMSGVGRPSKITEPMYHDYIQSTGHEGATFMEHIEFVNQIERTPSQSASAEEGLWSVIVAAAAQESIKSGKVVQISDFLASQGLEKLLN